MCIQKIVITIALVLGTTAVAGCQSIGNTPSASSPILSPTPLATTLPTANPDQMSVVLEIPTPNQPVTSPFTVRGQAPGNWFFEGQLIAKLLHPNGDLISTTPLMADGEWMTTSLVFFEGAISYPALDQPIVATLRIQNDNPSGLAEMEKFAEFSIKLQ